MLASWDDIDRMLAIRGALHHLHACDLAGVQL